jgi:hypothetical protein
MAPGHVITSSTTFACARGRGARSYHFVSARCSCGEWEDAFEQSDAERRAEVREAARQHLLANRVPA